MRPTALILFAVLMQASCIGGRTDRAYAVNTGGVAERGRAIVMEKHCGSCHTIPNLEGADGAVGPPLTSFARRTYIAGELPNRPENLIRWVRSPQSVEPKTAMPNLGLSEAQARDVAAFLYTLR